MNKKQLRKDRKKAIRMQNNSSRKLSLSEALREVRKENDELSAHNQ